MNADQLRERLKSICPLFEPHPRDEFRELSLHSIMIDFSFWFGRGRTALDENALRQLALFLDDAVAVDDDLENAVATCFLEHLHQIDSYRALAPFISRRVDAKTRP